MDTPSAVVLVQGMLPQGSPTWGSGVEVTCTDQLPVTERALTLISSKDACNAGLSCDPCLLLLLILDPVSVLDVQVPVGRHLLHALDSMNIR